MNKIIDFLKSLLQLSKVLVITFGLFLFIGGCWLFYDLQYRYVVDSRYNTIFDKAYSVYLINKGISMDIINDKIYAMDDDVYVIINQERNTIIVYYLNLEDVETINNFTRLQQQYYGDKMILQPIESLGPSETFDIYKKLSEAPRRFKSQGSRISF
jgi:putative DNA gyrase, B subunit